MIYQRNNIGWRKLNGGLRYLVVHLGCNGMLGYCLVNEYPRSGGSWLGQMLARVFGMPFPRNRLPMLRPSIMHGHYLHAWNIKKAVILWRDGRDVIVSQYFHHLFENERHNAVVVKAAREHLGFSDYTDIRSNLPAFIRYVFEESPFPGFSWVDFVDRWVDNRDVVHAHYEALRTNTADELKRIAEALAGNPLDVETAERVAQEFSFENQARRQAGEEEKSSFLRKGIVGDWKNYFNDKARVVFDDYAGEALVRLGYEKDRKWV